MSANITKVVGAVDTLSTAVSTSQDIIDRQWRSEGGAGGAGRTGRHLPGAANGRNLEKNHGKIQTERGHRASITRKRGITVPSPPD